MNNQITISKASVHNLKSIDLTLPKNKLIVITGPSGSGKSSLAFDTIYVEGQRRYIESLSSYARQFLGQFQPPEVESITGLSPAIAIDQKASNRNPRSTVGTITEIYDYMRVLYARVGDLKCPQTGVDVKKYTPHQMVQQLLKEKDKTKLQIIAPIKVNSKKEFEEQLLKFQSLGFSRVFIGDKVITIDTKTSSLYSPDTTIGIVIDRILLKKESHKRLMDSVEYALELGNGTLKVFLNDKKIITLSQKMISPETEETFPELEPKLFSFNSPIGACPKCSGLGVIKSFSENLLIEDESLSINQGAIAPLNKKNTFLYKLVENLSNNKKFDLNTPYKDLSPEIKKLLFKGSENEKISFSFKTENSYFKFSKVFPGIPEWLNKKYHESTSEKVKQELENYMTNLVCSNCHGKRLNPIALSTYIGKKNIMDLSFLSIYELYQFFERLKLSKEKSLIADKVITEIKNRLIFLIDVGLGYLNLNRSASTLSGGESQRIRLATQVGSALSGVIYVLDEPSIGLHQRDNLKLISTLKSLRDLNNTVIVVEHDEETMREADYIVDLGVGAGVHGGSVVAQGTLKQILKQKSQSLTKSYLKSELSIRIPERRNLKNYVILTGAKENNLKNISFKLPLNGLICITGVSGSGKSTLIHNVFVPAVKFNILRSHRNLYKKNNYTSISGLEDVKSLIELDQSPIGRTPHSNPATYTGLFDPIRKIFSQTNEAQVRGYKPGRFSFNVKGGRCEACEGNGKKKIEMHFMPDIYLECDECLGSRYNHETLSILYRGKNISDVLEMTIEEAAQFFINHPRIHRILETMCNVGLGYIKLGQSATTLSGGEAQRLKLSRELAKKTKGHCLYILDEPTTGLHFNDIKILLNAIHDLINKGNSVIVIEHNLDVIKTADWIIDLGPEGGDKGGRIIGEGTPEVISSLNDSYTGKFLKPYLK